MITPNYFGIELISILNFGKNRSSNPGLSRSLNFTFGERSMWYMRIYKLRYLIIEDFKFSVGIRIVT